MKLNNKGFTLIELLATIVILSVVMAIVIPFGINYYDSAKRKSQEIFIEKINKLIDDYIALNASKFVLLDDKTISFQKCKLDPKNSEVSNEAFECKDGYKAKKVKINDNDKIPFRELVNEKLISESEFINPYNKKNCKLDNGNDKNYIEIYQDDDKVNYFRYKLECIVDIDEKNYQYVYEDSTISTSNDENEEDNNN